MNSRVFEMVSTMLLQRPALTLMAVFHLRLAEARLLFSRTELNDIAQSWIGSEHSQTDNMFTGGAPMMLRYAN